MYERGGFLENRFFSEKNKHFFSFSDLLAESTSLTRQKIADSLSISYSCVEKIAESLLDTGLISEHIVCRSYEYYYNRNTVFMLIDISTDIFKLLLCSSDGSILHKLTYNRTDNYFFDEHIALFFRQAYIFVSRLKSKPPIKAFAVITPHNCISFKGTKNILNFPNKLISSLKDSFNNSLADAQGICLSIDEVINYHLKNERSLVVTNVYDKYYLSLTGNTNFKLTEIHPIDGIPFSDRKMSTLSLSASLACAVGNAFELISPNKVYLNGESYISNKSFAVEFKSHLCTFLNKDHLQCDIVCVRDEFNRCGSVRLLRHMYIEKLLEVEHFIFK